MDRELCLANSGQRDLAIAALKLWLPSAHILFDRMPPGRSGVDLVKVDISGDTADLVPGTYVLRVGPTEDDLTEPNEFAAHRLIRQADKTFAADHIPQLLRLYQSADDEERRVVSLHDVAGGSFAKFVPPSRESTGLLHIAAALSEELMRSWADPHNVSLMHPYDMLELVVGEEKAHACRTVIRDMFGDREILEEDGHIFVNPAGILDPTTEISMPVMAATGHRDLHVGNLLVPRYDIEEDGQSNFWIVDVDQAGASIAGFDLAYLEVSVLINFYPGIPHAVLSSCLGSSEQHVPKIVPDGYRWLVDFLRASRQGLASWIERQPGRADDLSRQIIVVRILAALLWARRFPGTPQADTCLAYAGWYALHYRRNYPLAAVAAVPASVESDEHLNRLWGSFWLTVSQFSPRAGRYVLVAEQMPRVDSLSALGQLPWSVIIDLDPTSDRDGLHAKAGMVLETQRALHLFTANRPQVDYSNGTAWLLAAGSTLRREPLLQFRQWVYQRINTVRQLTASFRGAVGDVPVVVLILEGGTDSAANSGHDRLLRVIDAMDEVLQGTAMFIHVGLADIKSTAEVTNVPLSVPDVLRRLAETLGSTAQQRNFGVPAMDGATVNLTPGTMRTLQEYMTVLHEDIDISEPMSSGRDDAFWRGGQIRWVDLGAEVDVPRTVNGRLLSALEDSLDSHRTKTVVLEHQPGSGGTTVALRAAWELHHGHPVAILHMGSAVDAVRVPLIADRLHRLFVLTQRPVLLVAESSDLSDPYREALYRELAARSARVTMLYVRRVVGKMSRTALAVSEPLDDKESKDFYLRYADLTDDPRRKNELSMLSTEGYSKYRTPFFYGLITFEREFIKLEAYVRTHLGKVRGRAREVLQYLALATIFSNSGLQAELVQKLMRVSVPSSDLDLTDLLGAEAGRLVTMRAGRLRLLHQLLAEQVLAELLNDERWVHHLKDLAIDFIQALAITTDPSSEPVRMLLRQMFVDRLGGTADGVEDRRRFAPLIERLDEINPSLGHQVLTTLTEFVPEEPHFWNHLGRHQMYRLERDLDKAEEYVAKAVELAPNDSLHHHTLGLARRSRMRQQLRRARRQGLQAVMTVTDEWFARTIECFVTARSLSPDNIYGYITHVQAVVDVAKNLKDVGRVRSVAELTADAGEWVTEHLAEANELLDTAAQLYGTLDQPDIYMTRCEADIRRLYDDLDSVVELWETAVAGTRSTPMLRRALAQAFYVRGNRSWRQLEQAELARIVDLAGHNLSQHGAKEEDYRLWFEAYKLLPDFDFDEAISKLQGWAAKFPSWRAHFYQYCLYFYLWFTSRSNDPERFRVEQQDAQAHVPGRTKRSYLWLANSPSWCPFISDSDLGEWNRNDGFWSNTTPLQRVNGVIDVINGPQAGRIQLDLGVSAFFVPKIGTFQRDSDETKAVNFFLGFSPEGLRAWDVQKGHLESAVDARDGHLPLPDSHLKQRTVGEISPQVAAERADELYHRRVIAFCISILEAHWTVGDITLSYLVGLMQARFRDETSDFVSILATSGRIAMTDSEDPVVCIVGADPARPDGPATQEPEGPQIGRILFINDNQKYGFIEPIKGPRARFDFAAITNWDSNGPPGRGQVVRFVVAGGLRGSVVREMELLPKTASFVDGEVVAAEKLHDRVEADVRAEIERQLAEGEPDVDLTALQRWLEDRFVGGMPLATRLSINSIDQLWPQYSWLTVTGRQRGRRARMTGGLVFGRVPSVEGEEPSEATASRQRYDFGATLSEIATEVMAATGRWPSLKKVQSALRNRLGSQYAVVVGPSLPARLEREPGWKLEFWRVSPVTEQDAAESFGSALRVVAAAMERDGRELNLQAIGAALRARMGAERYTASVGSSLKRRIEREPGWNLVAARPSIDILTRGKTRPAASAPPGGYTGDFPGLVSAVAQELAAAGLPLTLANVGDRMRQRLGAEDYRAMVPEPLAALLAKHGWVLTEESAGRVVIHRPEAAG